MYLVPGVNDSPRAAPQGLAQPRDTSDRQQSLDAILKALQLNPVGGYVKGSAARRQLEAAIDSVPRTSALELHDQLGTGTGPLGKLFKYRLHEATQKAMRDILWTKHLAQKKAKEEADLSLKQACDEARKAIAKNQAVLKTLESAVEKACALSGEDSDQCQEFRFTLLEARTRLDDVIRSAGAKCP
ncbi:MAG: hypothetical protein ABI831_12390 [Betaproteobacteria bacterium]